MMEENKKIDNAISVFEEVLEKYKNVEDLKEPYEQLKRLKEKRENKKV